MLITAAAVRRWVAMHGRRPPRTQNANGVENQKSEHDTTKQNHENCNFSY